MDDENVAESPPYAAVVRRQWWLMLTVALVCLAAGLSYAAQQRPLYRSSALVLVRSGDLFPTNPNANPGFLNIRDERQVATSAAVAALAQKKLGPLGLGDGGISVSSQENLNSLTFTAVSGSARLAQRVAQAFADAYLDHRRETVLSDLTAAVKPIQDRIDALSTQIDDVQLQLDKAKTESTRTSLQIQLNSLLNQRTSLEQSRDQLILPQNVRVGEVLQAAGLPLGPSNHDPLRAGLVALILGAALGVGIGFLRDRFDTRIHAWAEAERITGAPVLGVLPRRRWLLWRRPDDAHQKAELEAFRALRVKVLAATQPDTPTILLMTSSTANKSRQHVIVGLATALAESRRRVIVVAARESSAAAVSEESASSESRPSITSGPSRWADTWAERGTVPGRSLNIRMEPVSVTGYPRDGREGLGETVAELLTEAELVLVDAPEVGGQSTALELAGHVDGIILIEELGAVTRGSLSDAAREFDQVGGSLLGIVLAPRVADRSDLGPSARRGSAAADAVGDAGAASKYAPWTTTPGSTAPPPGRR